MRNMNVTLKLAALVASLLAAPACVQGLLGYAGIFNGSVGSCTYPETAGYVACEDFLGSDYGQELAESLCANGAVVGTWSADPCPTAGALGSCLVVPFGTGESQTYQYTYTASTDPDSGVTANALNAETACGVAGGAFAPAQ
jgi:hypothetical protein